MRYENIISKRNNKVIYRDGDNAVKVFDMDFSKADVLNEALNQARIEETGLNIPKIKEIVMVVNHPLSRTNSDISTVKIPSARNHPEPAI